MVEDSSASRTSTPQPIVTQVSQVPQPPTTLENHALQITQHKLNGTNFKEWFQSVLLVIHSKGKIKYLNGTISKPSADSETYGIWEVENSIVMAWLVNSIEPRIGRIYLFYKTTQEIWEAIQEIYSDMENTA